MPLDEIQGVLSAPDLRERNERITAHRYRLEGELGTSGVDPGRGDLDSCESRGGNTRLAQAVRGLP
jgi:hypothetical protein